MSNRFLTRLAIARLCRAIKKRMASEPSFVRLAWYGAYDIHPRHLVVWIIVTTDGERDRLIADQDFRAGLRRLLVEVRYPGEGRDGVSIEFASQETVNRDWGGDWWQFFK